MLPVETELRLAAIRGAHENGNAMPPNPITRNLDILGGEAVFAGTRVPVEGLFDHLEAGDSIEDFLDGFPSVRREQVIALLETAKARLLIGAEPAV